MVNIVVFHSVLGLRPVELGAAERLRAAGHDVVTPDLYAGSTAPTLEEGFALMDHVGWTTISGRASDAVRDLPPATVLLGVSMGCGVVQGVLPDRPVAAGVLLLHALGAIPASARAGLPVQVHVADPDPIAPPAEVAAWRAVNPAAAVFTYPGAGHFYTDAEGPDHDEAASALTWQRVLGFLRTLPQA
ncbi:dienelactone hydrolase family protein [Amycolatopsis sp. WQ 127309]|uniref:dienelactone hydrolase family protein n=1 Tax=Amycolatopsis sp. WQ 127309 TaxID=2932773 RepID=UPI001FF5029D|nr:dienelactone hydrolase family protein [Amycolatopsis sp. WQ 127309]UOZ11533.1 dienelactone hydrolase family protein [Amycolatopsis sp. WQ 127309]